ncbi:MAG TPA: TIGR04086 family membrane protein [bacterium]|nr:TIGR04086 family membrane protein [bacterium]
MKPNLGQGRGPGLVVSLQAVVKAVFVGIMVYVGLALVATVVISFYANLELQLPLFAFVAQYAAAFMAAMAAGIMADRWGWAHGLGSGIAFMGLISLAAVFLLPVTPTFSATLLWRLLPGLLLGLGGGIIGANL